MSEDHTPDWRTQGVRVVPGDQLDTNTPQTPGMLRAAAITNSEKDSLWRRNPTSLSVARVLDAVPIFSHDLRL